MIDEMIEALRNALEHGETLERAAQSFVNAGYNPREVEEAKTKLAQGASSVIQGQSGQASLQKNIPSQKKEEPKASFIPFPLNKYAPQQSGAPTPKPSGLVPPLPKENTLPPKHPKRKMIIIICLLLLLISLIILFLLFKDDIFAFIK